MDAESKPRVFVIMPFQTDFLAFYDLLKGTFADKYEFTNAGDLDNQQNILKDIVEGIACAAVVIADLTGLNPNVFYELGLSHAMNKKTIIITQDISDLPFDIKSYRVIEYSMLFHKVHSFLDELAKLLNGAIDGSVVFGNPVTDYAPHNTQNIDSIPIERNNRIVDNTSVDGNSSLVDSSECGFLDYIAEIQEHEAMMSAEIGAMGKEINEMSGTVDESTAEIERVKKASGKADAVFVRNICRHLSSPINNCAINLKEHIIRVEKHWDSIETNFLKLLESDCMKQKEQKESIRDSKNALQSLQDALSTSDLQIDGFILALKQCRGIERRLNKSIDELSGSLDKYLSITSKIFSSIERIITRCEIAISEIEAKEGQ